MNTNFFLVFIYRNKEIYKGIKDTSKGIRNKMRKMVKKKIFKICILGDEGIGKEKFIELFAKQLSPGLSPEQTKSKIGVTLYWEPITVNTEKGPQEYIIQIWNFVGHKRFKFLLDSRYM